MCFNEALLFFGGYGFVAVCEDDCVTALSEPCKQWFADMGSKEIWKLTYRNGFAFIGVSGRNECNEKVAGKITDEVQLTQIFQVDPEAAKKI